MTKSRGIRPRWTDEQRTHVAALYEQGYSMADIGAIYGRTGSAIKYHLLKHGVTLRPTGMRTERHKEKRRGSKHHKWNGGRRINGNGYVEVLCYDERGRHYVAEHRLVLEEHLQKTAPQHPALGAAGKLRRDWVVHHINGVKTDNCLENLEPMPRSKHHSWIHYRAEVKRLKHLLTENGIEY